jgi:hypothetical protein
LSFSKIGLSGAQGQNRRIEGHGKRQTAERILNSHSSAFQTIKPQPADRIEDTMSTEMKEAQPFIEGDSTRVPPAPGKARMKRASGGRISVTNVNFGIPTNELAKEHVMEQHGSDSWSAAVLHFLHAPKIQMTLMLLLFLDVIILFTEMYVAATFP